MATLPPHLPNVVYSHVPHPPGATPPLSHDLSAQVPGGPFFTDVNCASLNVPGKSP